MTFIWGSSFVFWMYKRKRAIHCKKKWRERERVRTRKENKEVRKKSLDLVINALRCFGRDALC